MTQRALRPKDPMDPMISTTDSNEVVNALTHGVGALLALIAVVGVIIVAGLDGKWLAALCFAVYGAGLVASLAASGLLHLSLFYGRYRRWLGVVDHVAIYALIAGSFTPICVLVVGPPVGYAVLAAVWGLALLFSVAKVVTFTRIPVWASLASYLLMGWLGVFVIAPLYSALGVWPVGLLLLSGVLYTIGTVIFVSGRPNPRPPYFGSHEIWHVAVLSANALMLLVMLVFVLPYAQ